MTAEDVILTAAWRLIIEGAESHLEDIWTDEQFEAIRKKALTILADLRKATVQIDTAPEATP